MIIKLIIGPMFSGKTSKLITNYDRLITSNISSKNILVINHTFDTRYSQNCLATHNNVTDIGCEMIQNLTHITPKLIKKNDYKAILINEGQFFEDIHNWVKIISKSDLDTEVIICGLDADYKQEPFADFLNIIPYCRSVEKLTSICSVCFKHQAEMTIRTSENKDQVVIGNHDIYRPICSECY